MLSNAELAVRLGALKLPEVGIAYIHRARSSPPSRNVSSTDGRNTTWRYASHKMACTIQAESTLERDFLVRCEYAKDIAEFWDQPEAVSVSFIGKNGRHQRVSYTPDFLVIADTGVTAYQVKPSKQCNRLVEQRPSRWSRDGDGYADLSAAEPFTTMGIRHCVVTEREIGAIASENFSLLLQARRDTKTLDTEHSQRMLAVLAEDGVLTAAELLRRSCTKDATWLLRLIDEGQVIALLSDHRLADLEDALVSLDKSYLNEVNALREMGARTANLEGTPHTQAPSLDQIKGLVLRLRHLKSAGSTSASKSSLYRGRVQNFV